MHGITLVLDGRDVRVTGGPFDALPPGARGLCLEAGATRKDEAEWCLDIPDYGIPDATALRDVLRLILAAMRATPEATYHIGCRAGLGRTGLVLGCLAQMTGVEGDAVSWVRSNYHPDAIETAEQEASVRRFSA